MTNRTIVLSDAIYSYLLSQGIREPQLLKQLRQETAQLPACQMQIAPEQGQFMAMLIKLMNAKTVIELGTYTGYSALVMALALPADGQLVTCDTDVVSTAIARRYWEQAGVASKIELMVGEALESLNAFDEESFDLAFIDADKRNYQRYYEKLLRLVRPGGLILIDNVLWSGRLVDARHQEKNTQALREFNHQLYNDARIELCMLPLGDGLTMARRLS